MAPTTKARRTLAMAPTTFNFDRRSYMTTPTNNTEFLQAVFAGLTEPHRAFVLGFDGKPKERKAWGGNP